MDAEKYRTLLKYKKNNEYPTGFSKQDKTVLRKHAKKLEFDPKSNSLFYLSKQRDGTTLKRLVVQEDEKARVFAECHSANFSGHAATGTIRSRKLNSVTTGQIITRIQPKW